MQKLIFSVGLQVDLGAKPGQLFADPPTHLARPFTDAGSEHKAVDAAHGSREISRVESDPIDEMIERERGAGLRATKKLAHIIADSGQPLQPTVLVEEILHRSRAHPLFAQEIEHHTRIDLARPRSHRQAIQGRETHGALDAAPFRNRTHRRAAAEMSDDDPAFGTIRHCLAHALRDVFIGEPVESVSAHAFGIESFRNCVMVRDVAMAAMKGGVETGDLRHVREALHQNPDWSKVVRLMQRRERHIALKIGQHLVVHQGRAIV